ncbi:MAG: 16S rRNA (uracil(1498)-N(3))-methyltransferase [Chryseolinea sp.]
MNLFYQPGISDAVLHLDAAESRHVVKVLRKKKGDAIQITDGKGFLYNGQITVADKDHCAFQILQTVEAPKRDYQVHIAISLLKNSDRLEWFVEKSIELGVDEITLLHCHHTEKQFLKMERLEKIAISAMKQSLTMALPRMNGPLPFDNFVMQSFTGGKFIAHVDHENQTHLQAAIVPQSPCLVMIGPEGDFSTAEVALAAQHSFTKVSLGASRLRTETAGIAACHIVNLVNTR